MNWKAFPLLLSSEDIVENWWNFFLRYLEEFISDSTWAWCFWFGKVINYWFNFFNRCRSIQIFSIFLCEFLQIVSFRELAHFILVITFVVIEWFMVFPYCLKVYTAYSDVFSFTLISEIWVFLFFWVSLRSTLLIFSKNLSFWFIDFLF